MKLTIKKAIIITVLTGFGTLGLVLVINSNPVSLSSAPVMEEDTVFVESNEIFLSDLELTDMFVHILRERPEGTTAVPYDDSVLMSSISINISSMPDSAWEGVGYIPRGPAGIEGTGPIGCVLIPDLSILNDLSNHQSSMFYKEVNDARP